MVGFWTPGSYPTLSITRAEIPTTKIRVSAFAVLGYATLGDGGQGAVYVQGSSSGPMAIQDESGTWFELVVTDRVNIKWFGAKDGDTTPSVVTANTTAINAAISALPAISGTFGPGNASHELYVPAGIFYTNGGHVIPSTKRIVVVGEGDYHSTLFRQSGANADLLTLNSQTSGVRRLGLAAARSSSTGDGLVMNTAYNFAESCSFTGFDNGIVIGKASGAGGFRLHDLRVRDSKAYNIYVVSGISYDGMWTNIDSGNSGKSSVRIDAGAQNLVNVHVWGGGLEDSSDKHGFLLKSPNNHFANCESECNNGWGLVCDINADGTNWTGGYIWGNKSSGWYQFSKKHTVINGAHVYNNCVGNTSFAVLDVLAGIENQDSTECTFTGNTIYDNSSAIAAPTYSTYTPAFPYPGRAGVATQAYAYTELGTSDHNTITGNTMRAERCLAGFTGAKSPTLVLGNSNRVSGNNWGNKPVQSVASAATITLPPDCDLVQVTGTTNITTITGAYLGRKVTLKFSNASPGTLVKGSNLAIDRDYTPPQNGTITLMCELGSDQTTKTWYEVSRSHTA
jgi:hypothetical protein